MIYFIKGEQKIRICKMKKGVGDSKNTIKRAFFVSIENNFYLH